MVAASGLPSAANAARMSASSRMPSEVRASESWSAASATAACARQARARAARQVGHGNQGFPGVGGAVFQRHGRGGAFEVGQVLAEPPGQLASDRAERGPVAAVPERRDRFAGGAAAHLDHHRAVLDGVGHGADPGQGGHREGGDGFQAAGAGVPADGGPVALVPGVEQAAQVLVGVGVLAAEDRVGLIDQQRGRGVGADGPVDRGRVRR